MKNVLFRLRKLNNPFTYSIAMCAAGLAFVILSKSILDLIILVVGGVISLLAIALIAAWAFAPEKERGIPLIRHGAIIKSSILLLFGISIMLIRSSVSRTVCIILGIILSLYSVFRLSRPSRIVVERDFRWYLEGIVLVFFIFLGASIAIFPLWPKITAGIALLALGAKLLVDEILIRVKNGKKTRTRAKKSAPGQKRSRPTNIYSDDFVDKSHEI